jgi:hypothetical protein
VRAEDRDSLLDDLRGFVADARRECVTVSDLFAANRRASGLGSGMSSVSRRSR